MKSKNAIPQLWGIGAILNLLFCEKTYMLACDTKFIKKDLWVQVNLCERINNSET
jgi:molybdopterin-guanine dinucleotide biosynthesis protein A